MSEGFFSTLLITALLSGLTGSGHCAGMCGGIALTLGSAGRHSTLAITFNLARISGYALFGLLAGTLSQSATHQGSLTEMTQALRLLAATVMITAGAGLLGATRGLNLLEHIGRRLWQHIQPLLKGAFPVQTPRQALRVGLLWGLMPCGLVYAALSCALASGSPLLGMSVMLAFGIGTLPAMVAMSLLGQQLIRHPVMNNLRTLNGLLLLAGGLWTLLNAFSHLHH